MVEEWWRREHYLTQMTHSNGHSLALNRLSAIAEPTTDRAVAHMAPRYASTVILSHLSLSPHRSHNRPQNHLISFTVATSLPSESSSTLNSSFASSFIRPTSQFGSRSIGRATATEEKPSPRAERIALSESMPPTKQTFSLPARCDRSSLPSSLKKADLYFIEGNKQAAEDSEAECHEKLIELRLLVTLASSTPSSKRLGDQRTYHAHARHVTTQHVESIKRDPTARAYEKIDRALSLESLREMDRIIDPHAA